MSQAIFQTELNEAFTNPKAQADMATAVEVSRALEAQVFEQLMLFDKVHFKVVGQNAAVSVLLKMFGTRGLEELLDQRAVAFTLWTQDVMSTLTEVEGLDPLVSGTQTTPSHCDPEESLDLVLKANPALTRGARRMLAKKILPVYGVPRKDLAAEAVKLTNSAFASGKLRMLGFTEEETDLRRLKLTSRQKLGAYATDLLHYSYLLEKNLTSYTKPAFYAMFEDSASKLEAAGRVVKGYHTVAEYEDVPDLQALYDLRQGRVADLPKLRSKRNSVRFRAWLSSAAANVADIDVTKAYIRALEAPESFFETRKGKIAKSCIKTALGAGIGGALGGAEGAGAGVVIAHVGEPLVDLGLDMLDELVLSGLMKGWTPRMFMKDLKRLAPPEKDSK